jgi:tripartite ATP-independent transporter DctP family solute receptor
MRFKALLTGIAAAGLLLPAGALQAQNIKERTVKFATQNPKGHPIVMGMEKFAEIVAAKSGGKIKVQMFPGGVLGGDAPNISALQGGTLDMVVLNAGILASQVKEFAVYDFPFMFATPQEADAVVDGPFGKMLLDKLDAKGIHGLAYWELGFRNITNSRRPIVKVEDIAGLKLRVIPNAINVDWVKALGANPTPMAFPEVYRRWSEGDRRAREPVHRDQRQQAVRGAEVPGGHQPPVQPAGGGRQQEALGHAERR